MDQLYGLHDWPFLLCGASKVAITDDCDPLVANARAVN
jgi:hypothetical protein